MARTKKLTDPIYSPTNPTSEAAIRAQIDDSIQEVYDQSSRNDETVNLTGNQTIAGIKTFSSSPIVPAPTTDLQVSTKKYVDDRELAIEADFNAKDAQNVKLTGNQTIADVKTFSSSPIVPEPTTNLQASTKKYVDDGLLANKTGDHLGTWQGYTPTLANPGISSVVEEHTSEIEELNNETRSIKSNPTNIKSAVVSFIDDDSGQYTPEIWGEIIANKNIKMGFAVVTKYADGTEIPVNPALIPMPLSHLQSLYDAGHDVYSHSYSHPAFYDDLTTLETIETECVVSQNWLNDNGFTRTSDIIVYPGGLGQTKVDKKNIIRKYYKYGIDTIVGVNPVVVDNWCIFRPNADTSTLEQLKVHVDEANSKGLWLVFMNHSYEMYPDKVNQIAKIEALIDYIRSLNIPIMQFSEAEKYKGNVLAVGEFTENNSTFINAFGQQNKGLLKNSLDTIMSEPIETYNKGDVTVKRLTSVQDTSFGKGGNYTVHRALIDDSYSFSTFVPFVENEIYMRKWVGGAWGTWQEVGVKTGTWTPSLVGSTVAGNHTYVTRVGKYAISGNIVTVGFNIRINYADLDALMSGDLRITGLPVIAPIDEHTGKGVLDYNIINLGAGYTTAIVTTNGGQGYLSIIKLGNNVAGAFVAKSDLPVDQVVVLVGQVSYRTV